MPESQSEQLEREEGAELEGEMSESGEDESGSQGKQLSFATMANRNVSRARKLFGSEREPDETAQFMVQSATVYAILELADAVRSQQTG